MQSLYYCYHILCNNRYSYAGQSQLPQQPVVKTVSWVCYLSLPVRVGRPSSSLAGRKSRGMRPRDNSKFSLAVRMSSQSSGGDTGHMIVSTSFMLFGCANPARQAIVRLQLLYKALGIGKHTGHAMTISLDLTTDDSEAHSSRSPIHSPQEDCMCCRIQMLQDARQGRAGKGRTGQDRAGKARPGQGQCTHHNSVAAVHCFCPHSQW